MLTVLVFLSEEGFRDAMRYVVEEVSGIAKVERWAYNDVEGFVHGIPSVVEVDLLIKDKEHVLLEVKSGISRGGVMELHRVREYEKITGIKPRLAIMGGFIDRGAKELAEKLGVEIVPTYYYIILAKPLNRNFPVKHLKFQFMYVAIQDSALHYGITPS